MKISKYITKYDYIAYYTKPEYFWFYKNDEIKASLETIYKQLQHSNNKIDDYSEDENTVDDFEFDSYEYYTEIKNELSNIDDNNPLIVEGKILDQESKKHIINIYNKEDVLIVDFDDKQYKNKTMEELSQITQDIILNNKNIIFFQPVFISNNMITKPDAFIKRDRDFIVIETKGTTTSKIHHFLDILYQKNVIESIDYLNQLEPVFDYFLCIVKYERLLKDNVSFVITPYINPGKSLAFNTIIKKSVNNCEYLKACAKMGYVVIEDTNNIHNQEYNYALNLKKITNGNVDIINERLESKINHSTKKSLEAVKEKILLAVHEFDDVIDKLWQHKSKMSENDYVTKIYPNKNDKGLFKNFDFFPEERKIYSLYGYNRFDYSGKIADQSGESLINAKIKEDLIEFIKPPSKNSKIDYLSLFQYANNFDVNLENTFKLWNQLKNKKVYFDFETLNTSIRPIDNCFPFNQIVTQCSIIKDDGTGIENVNCDNLIIDPTSIDLNWYKKVIDSIYYGANPVYDEELEKYIIDPESNNISYIVYNKSFEKTRLEEMAHLINDKYYFAKVESIIKNIFDIADFFILSSSNGYCLFFKELCGFYSIKKVLPLISKYSPEVFNKTKCLNYNDLEVYNGKICQDKTALRFFKLIDDNEWKTIASHLQIYCENDVRAMIAVEYFIKEIIDGKEIC